MTLHNNNNNNNNDDDDDDEDEEEDEDNNGVEEGNTERFDLWWCSVSTRGQGQRSWSLSTRIVVRLSKD